MRNFGLVCDAVLDRGRRLRGLLRGDGRYQQRSLFSLRWLCWGLVRSHATLIHPPTLVIPRLIFAVFAGERAGGAVTTLRCVAVADCGALLGVGEEAGALQPLPEGVAFGY